MSSSSSLDLEANLDIGESPIIKTVQSSYFESTKKHEIPISISPIPQESPKLTVPKIEPKKTDFSIDNISSISSTSKNSELGKNFIKKNIEITKKKVITPNLENLNILELGLEEEPEGKKCLVDVDQRFYKYQTKVQEKIQGLAKELKEKEQKICTFQPDVKSASQRRTTDQFLDQMKNFEKKKQDKIDALRVLKDTPKADDVHRPMINAKSKEILAKKGENQKPIFEKLYEKKKTEKKVPEKTPPKTQPRVTNKRSEPVEKILYEDALRRASKQPELKLPQKEVLASNNSQLVLAKKFMKEFQEVFVALNGETEFIDLELATKGLVCLNFIRNNSEHPKFEEEKVLVQKFFSLIGAVDSVKISNLLKICLATVNIYIPSMTIPQEQSLKPNLGCLIDSEYSATREEVTKVHKFFNVFYENRQLSNQVIKEINNENYSFKPQLTPSTQAFAKLAQQRSGSLYSIKREVFIQEEKKKAQEKIEKIKKEREEEEIKLCTFKPTLISKSLSKKEFTEKDRRQVLYDKSKEINEKKKVQIQNLAERELEKDMSECTFAPKVERIKIKEDSDVLFSKSVQQQLLRMQKAREEQERKKMILERPAGGKGGVFEKQNSKSALRTPFNETKPKSPLNFTKPKSPSKSRFLENCDDFSPIPFNYDQFTPKPEPESEEIQLEVKLPNGRVKTLTIPPGANKELKLSMFIIENRLTEEMGEKLRTSLLSIY